jgi:predicted acylesterase/phospholipase RssA/MinD-like ATPase involved in chromosome partitioning or flagellar assembly
MIYTFYSYKGGVGRSMAVANLAECFYEKGLRTLVVDWDLEAPGIETYFYPYPEAESDLKRAREHQGLVDLLLRFKGAFPEWAARTSLSASVIPPLSDEQAKEIEEGSKALIEMLENANNLPDYLRTPPAVLEQERPRASPLSLSDYLLGLYDGKPASSPDPTELAASPLRAYLQVIHGQEPGRTNGLYLMSAGARAEPSSGGSASDPNKRDFKSYASAVQGFDWSEFYAAFEGDQYFDWLRKELEKVADVVLIDSRTGVTEMGGVCTQQMADAVVCFCAPNSQNLDGVAKIISGLNSERVKQARKREKPDVNVMVIPTRIDNAESGLLTEFSERFDRDLEKKAALPAPLSELQRPLWNLRIPYIPRYNYKEKRVIGPGVEARDVVTQDLIGAYRKIAVHLAVLASDPSVRSAYSADFAFYFPEQGIPHQAPQPPENWVPRPVEAGKLKDALLKGASSPSLSRVAVCGPAGIGKTALVASVCNDPTVVSAFTDGIVWISFDKFWNKGDLYEFLRTTFGVRGTGEASLVKELAEKRFLLVIDDVWDLRDVGDITRFGSRCTQLLITPSSNVAALFAPSNLVALGTFTGEQSGALLNLPQPIVFDDEHKVLAQELQSLPLGASLMRTAYERAVAQQQNPEQAMDTVRQALVRHGVTAFDNLRTSDRSQSLSRSLQQTLSRISPQEKKLLILLVKANKGVALSETETVLLNGIRKLVAGQPLNADEKTQLQLVIKPEYKSASSEGGSTALSAEESARASLKRLSDLSLIRSNPSTGLAQVPDLVAEYLTSQGELGALKTDTRKGPPVMSSEDRQKNPDVQRATAILHGESAALDEIQSLAERLKDSRYFDLARRLFSNARKHPDAGRLSQAKRLKLIQRHALCTYRDLDLSTQRFEAAQRILEEGDLNEGASSDPTPSQETLGLAGAIFKNRWKLTGQRDDLERSSFYYNRGWQQPLEGDFGYTGINAAFVLDLLARMERNDSPKTAEARMGEAIAIREAIASGLPPVGDSKNNAWLKREWWYFATLAEACFGAARYEEARFWLREGLALDPPGWQLESTARQLATLAYAQNPTLQEDSEAWNTLRVIAGDGVSALRGIEIGKIGLALSGGGFRASLFHIGLLARLAELDVLRQVEVLSCVSGGSIIGAHYYLEVRRLLEEKADSEITADDYIKIVARIEQEFLAGVQKNLRTRLFANLGPNLLSLIVPGYTRTKRLGSLYEKHIYRRVKDAPAGPLYLEDLRVHPKAWEGSFNPKLDNWRRSAKIPILLLNATTLNTGHNWQFSVSWMGEPPASSGYSVDRNEILRRMYYWQAPGRYKKRKLRLGHAVAASSCVPALFDPIEFSGLYPDRTVRLVDGGVQDNQGIGGLLEQECNVVLVSDASGQMNSDEHPSAEISAVPLRANSILMARVREAEALQLDALRNASALNGMMFLHLKQDLEAQNVDWVDCDDPYEPLTGTASKSVLTTYGIPKIVQQHLAGLRTDLDSFTDREAYALMLSGYRMTDKNFRECVPQFPSGGDTRRRWNFLQIEPLLKSKEGRELEYARLVKMLEVGASRGFKIWKLWPVAGFLGVISLLAATGYSIFELWKQHPNWPMVAAYVCGVPAALWLFHRAIGSRKSVTVIATGLLLGTVGWLAALVHLIVFDPLFLLNGSMLKTGSSRVTRSFLPLLLTIVLIVGGAIGMKHFGGALIQPSNQTMQLRNRAASEQAAGHYEQAAALWTQLLAATPPNQSGGQSNEALAQIYSDRAYCYKLLGLWEKSIPDLTAALASNPSTADSVRLLNDRGGAYVGVGQPEPALADYNAVLKLDPGNVIAASNQSWLADSFKATQPGVPPLFVFLKFTHDPVTSVPEALMDVPDPVKKLYPKTVRGLNLRGWPAPISQSEVRYNDEGSRDLAMAIVKGLMLRDFAVKGPILTRSTATPRVELWLATQAVQRR